MWSVIKNSPLERESADLKSWLLQEGSQYVKDTLGGIQVPKLAQWGANTQRAWEHLPIDQPHSRMPFRFIQILAMVKYGVYHVCNREKTIVNGKEYRLQETDKAQCLILAATEIMENTFYSYKQTLYKKVVDSISVIDVLSHVEKAVKHGTYEDHFILSVYQTGSGTHTNMNMNEVLSTRATQIYEEMYIVENPSAILIHPNDHANICQSSNDVIPTAMRQCIHFKCVDQVEQLHILRNVWMNQANMHEATVKQGRTHLRDATPMYFSEELNGHVENQNSILSQFAVLMQTVAIPLGGTAVGSGLNTFEGYREKMQEQLSFTLQFPITLTTFCATGMAMHLPMMQYAGIQCTLVSFLLKYTQDQRIYTVAGEQGMKKLESGSSIMANKSNPTQCESLSQICTSVLTSLQSVYINNSLGNCQLNAYTPATMHILYTCLHRLTDSLTHFTPQCVETITYHTQKMYQQADSTQMNATKQNNILGYEITTKVAKYAELHNISLQETLVHSLDILTQDEYDRILNPHLFCQPIPVAQLIAEKYHLGKTNHIRISKRSTDLLHNKLAKEEEKTQVKSERK